MKKLVLLFFVVSLCSAAENQNELSRSEASERQKFPRIGILEPVVRESRYPSAAEHGPDPEVSVESLESERSFNSKKRPYKLSKNQKNSIKAVEEVLAIYKQQTGNHEAKQVPWTKILKHYLPEPFKSMEKINYHTFTHRQLYNYPEFMKNIRFVEKEDDDDEVSSESVSGVESVSVDEYQHLINPDTGDFDSNFIDSISEDIEAADMLENPSTNAPADYQNLINPATGDFDSEFIDSISDDVFNTVDADSMASAPEEYQNLMNPETGDFDSEFIDSISDDVFSTVDTDSLTSSPADYQHLINPATGDFDSEFIDSINDDVFSTVDADSLTVDKDVNSVERPTSSNSLGSQTYHVDAVTGRLFTKCTDPAAYYDSEFVFGPDFRDIMLLRFREESGWIAARRIGWKYVNRFELPVEYAHIKFSDDWLEETLKQKNYDLVNKVHFWRFKAREISEKRHNLMSAKAYYQKNQKKAREKVLEIFKQQTGIKDARHSDWSFFVPERLPAPYNTMNIDRVKFYKDKLYKIPEVMNNLHFEIKEDRIPESENEDEDSDSETVEKDPKRRKMFK